MKRRDAVAMCGLTMAGISSVKETGSSTNHRVLVIGAGLAGLAAAKKLQEAGLDVLVVEGRDRIGGRIWTSTKWPELPLDLGASWIHGVTGNPLTKIADEIGAERIATSYDSATVYDTSGEELDDESIEFLEEIRDELERRLKQAQDEDEDVSVRTVADELLEELDDTPENRRYLNFVLSGTIEQEYAGSVEKLSAQWFDSAKAYPGNDALFAEGFHQVIDHLMEDMRIETEQIVREIHWQESPIRIVCKKKTLTADRVIVTLPLGVLKSDSVRFNPALPEKKQSAIKSLGMGVLNKCYLKFTHAFWPDDVDWLEYVAEKHGEWTEWVSFTRTTDMPILLGFNAGDRGRKIETMSDEQIVASAMKTLKGIFGGDIPDPVDFQITRWAGDGFARGSYSFSTVGSTPQMRRDLASPLERKLYFAGEATDVDHYATAHGALQSGLRAAEEVLKAE